MSTFILFVGYVSILSVSLDTNKIDFNDFNGMEDKEYRNSLNILVESNSPYEVSASLESEIQNKDKTEIMDKSILEIKEVETVLLIRTKTSLMLEMQFYLLKMRLLQPIYKIIA